MKKKIIGISSIVILVLSAILVYAMAWDSDGGDVPLVSGICAEMYTVIVNSTMNMTYLNTYEDKCITNTTILREYYPAYNPLIGDVICDVKTYDCSTLGFNYTCIQTASTGGYCG